MEYPPLVHSLCLKTEIDRNMASKEDSNSDSSPPNLSFALRPPPSTNNNINKFLRSISTRNSSFFNSKLLYSPPRRSTPFPLQNDQDSPIHDYPTLSSSKSTNCGLTTYRCISSVLKKDGQILSIATNSNGLVYTGSDTNVIRIWKLPEFFECGQLKTKSKTNRVVALVASQERVYAAYGDGKIRVWLRTWDVGGLKHVKLATIPKTSNYVRSFYNIAGKYRMMKHMGAITSIAISVSEDILYSSSVDKTVKVWRISDLKCIETIRAHSQPINAITVADDGILYTASDDATVKVWRRNFCLGADQPHSLIVTLPVKQSPVKALNLTQDGGVLYGGCTDGYIHYWRKGWFSGQMQYGGALQGHTHAVMCLGSVANYVVSGSADSTSRVWARELDGSHSCLAVLVGHRVPIRCVAAFSSKLDLKEEDRSEDGCTFCTGSFDGALKVWRVTCLTKSVAHIPSSTEKSAGGCDYIEL